MEMFKKLLLCAGVVASLNASEELDITLENSAGKCIAIGSVKDQYSILSDPHISSEVEIASGTFLNFKVDVLKERYFIHSNDSRITSDGIEFGIIDEGEDEKVMQKFSILWEKDSTRVETKNLSGYQLIKKKSKKNNTFEFVLKTKEIDLDTDF